MSFMRNFLISNYLLATSGVLALVISKFLPIATLFFPLLAIALREHPKAGPQIARLPIGWLNAVTLMVFAYCAVVIFILKQDLIAAGVYFTIYLQVVKILTASKNRDFFQILLLSLAHLIAATLLSNDVGFILPFLIFMILAPWCFTLYNLKVQLEQAEAPERAAQTLKSRQIVGRRFFWITAAISVVLLINTLVIFYLFPRVSFGFLFKRIRPGQTVSGFSDKVDLNHFGEIKTSDAIVMRIESPDPQAKQILPDLYWRGLVYDAYDSAANKWRRTEDDKERMNIDTFSGRFTLRQNSPDSLFEHTITLEPLETQVLFAADRLYEVKWDKLQLERMLRHNLSILVDPYRSIYFNSNIASDRLYTAYSHLRRPTVDELRHDSTPFGNQADLLNHYTALPELSPRITALAKEIAPQATTTYDQAQAITDYLSSKYQYTLKVPEFKSNPIEDFLLNSRRGHCEYFATAAVLLMRSLNIPARLVSGFRGGDWNEVGNYFTVRERDAHTWVEVWFPNFSWQRFDPTPPDLIAKDFTQLRFAAVRKWIDYLELRWYRYIVNYDLQSQYQVALGAWKHTSLSLKGLRKFGEGDGWPKNLFALLKPRQTDSESEPQPLLRFNLVLLILLALALVGKSFLQRLKLRKQNKFMQADPIYQLYQRYCRYLERRGWRRPSSQTPQEFIASLKPELRSPELIQTYYRFRFGKQRTPLVELAKLRNWFKQVEHQKHRL